MRRWTRRRGVHARCASARSSARSVASGASCEAVIEQPARRGARARRRRGAVGRHHDGGVQVSGAGRRRRDGVGREARRAALAAVAARSSEDRHRRGRGPPGAWRGQEDDAWRCEVVGEVTRGHAARKGRHDQRRATSRRSSTGCSSGARASSSPTSPTTSTSRAPACACFSAVLKFLEKNDGRIVLCAMQPFVADVFEISGFSELFDDRRRRARRRSPRSPERGALLRAARRFHAASRPPLRSHQGHGVSPRGPLQVGTPRVFLWCSGAQAQAKRVPAGYLISECP